MNKTITISKEDFNNPLHPDLWDELCKEFGFNPIHTECLSLQITDVKKLY